MDVEDVLRWAYRDELPKRGAGAASGVSPMFSLIALGTHVDNISREPGFPAALGEPHPDAIAIEQIVIALERFSGFSIDGVDLAPDFGLAVDQGRALRHATAGMAAAVVVHARMGSRPLCHPPAFECGPVVGPNGKPKVLVTITEIHDGAFGPVPETRDEPAPATRAGQYPRGAFCPLDWTPSPQSVVDERADYLAWWVALDQLARDLSGLLATITALAPSAPMRPWAGDRELGKPPALFRPSDPVYRRGARTAIEARRTGEAQRARRERRQIAPATAGTARPPGDRKGGRRVG